MVDTVLLDFSGDVPSGASDTAELPRGGPRNLRVRRLKELRALLGELPEPALLLSAGRIHAANAQAERLLGWPARALKDRLLHELFHPAGDGRRQLRAAHEGQPIEGEAWAAQGTLLCADGSMRTVQASAAPAREPGLRLQLVLLYDLTDYARSQDQLVRAHARLAQLSSGLDAAQQLQRRRMADTLHDETQQALAAIRLNLDVARQAVQATLPDTADVLGRTSVIAQAALAATRSLIGELGTSVLDDLGLVAALEALAAQFGQPDGSRCSFKALGFAPGDAELPHAVERCLYRVAQEALANVGRHARAEQVDMRLSRSPEGALRLQVGDNGVGMGEEDRDDPTSLGLAVLQERLHTIGGWLEVRSTRGVGTVLVAHVPCGDDTAARAQSAPSEPEDTQAALLRFLYRVPVGLVQARLDGAIEMLNPVAARWLLPLSPDGQLDNLYSVLASMAPDLATRAQTTRALGGVVCDALPLGPAPTAGGEAPRQLSLRLVRSDATRLVAVLSDHAVA